MKTPTLHTLEPLLEQLRALDDLIEVRPGMFCLKSKPRQPFLHFHEEETGLFADLRTGPNTRQSARNSSLANRLSLRRLRDRPRSGRVDASPCLSLRAGCNRGAVGAVHFTGALWSALRPLVAADP